MKFKVLIQNYNRHLWKEIFTSLAIGDLGLRETLSVVEGAMMTADSTPIPACENERPGKVFLVERDFALHQ